MSTAYLDRVTTLSLQERHGIIVRLERGFFVKGLTNTDYKVLMSALEHLGIPQAGTFLGSEAPNLIVTERTPVVKDKGDVEVTVVYEHFLNEGQRFDDPLGGVFCGEVRTNLQQVTTNKDGSGELITVQHTYPEGDANFPGETKQQTGEIQVFVPQRTFTVQGLKNVYAPWLISWSIIGKVNLNPWSGAEARKWLCTSAGWKIADAAAGSNKYLMTFEFQHNPDGWDPTVVFIDEKTNRPPPNLVEGEGYKTIPYLEAVDFDSIVGTTLQGG